MERPDTGRRFRILLAEDDAINQDIIRAFLAGRADIDLTVVDDGRAALIAALGGRFDLMLFDHHMPFITGDRVIRFLRSGNGDNARTPVVRLSGDADRAEYRAIGGVIDAVLPKPLRGETLLATIDGILRQGRTP